MIGTDPRTDLALIKVDGSNFPYVKLAESAPRIGDWVLAVGNPFGLGGTVTAGIVSARGRDIGAGPYDDFLQIDAPVNKGNSGGPTFDTEGSVIGVNTAIFSPSGGSVGIAFAIPAETVKTVVAQLKDKGSVTRGWIGVQIQPVTPEIADSLGLKKTGGALVAEPQKDGPAVKAGIQAGDVITTVNGKPVTDARDLARKIGGMPPGTTVKLGIVRGGAEKTVSLTLGELPNAARGARRRRVSEPEKTSSNEPRLGLSLTPGGSEPGVVVAEVDPSGPAADFGFKAGDVILEVGGKTGRHAGRGAQGAGRGPRRRQAQRADAREVGTRDAVRRHSARPRLTSEDRAPFGRGKRSGPFRRHSSPPPAERTRGTGVQPVPAHTAFVYRHPSPPPGTRSVEGRRSDPPPLALFRGRHRRGRPEFG